MSQFVIHNIRGLRITDMFQTEGLDKAVAIAGHKSASTTLNNYLDVNREFNYGITWDER